MALPEDPRRDLADLDPARVVNAGAGADSALAQAVETMRAIRDRCVWTQQIDHRALVPYLLEESHELVDAVESGTRDDLREELGDLLWQVLFHAEIASRDLESPFGIEDVARELTAKMVRRHPHVFAGEVATTPEEVLIHWNAAKAAEKHTRRSVLDGVARSMPSLALAQKLVGKAAQVGVGVAEPPNPGVSVETGDLAPGSDTDPLSRAHAAGSEAQLGDALLSIVAAARARGWDAERALRERLRLLEDDIRDAEAG